MSSSEKEDQSKEIDDMLSGRGSLALMTNKEPAIRGLQERYSESFAVTEGTEGRTHLFLIKLGMWSLVWTFAARDFAPNDKIPAMEQTLTLIEQALAGNNPLFVSKLDRSVRQANSRIEKKAEEFSNRRHPKR